jgi:hypothetical protein
MEEGIVDLQAVRDGKSPLIARQRFNLEALGELEDGAAVDMPNEKTLRTTEEALTKYKMIVIILAALSAVLLLAVLFMALSR